MSEPDYAAEMALPAGKFCKDCIHFNQCKSMYAAKPNDAYCDFHPSRFKQKVAKP